MDTRFPATRSLFGLAVGDAFGAQILLPGDHPTVLERRLPAAPWEWTDDTEMACCIYQTLTRYGQIDQDALAMSFATHFTAERGYGSAAERMLLRYRKGDSWREVAPSMFGGKGSWGNGAAMRVAPLGAWYGPNLDAVVTEAAKSALVTHNHPEGVAGAIAVAVAAAIASTAPNISSGEFLQAVVTRVPDSQVRSGIHTAYELLSTDDPRIAGERLGIGHGVSAQDTVPLALWLAARNLNSFEDAMWTAARVAADLDTVCAITGGIIAAGPGSVTVQPAWLRACEPLPEWVG
ncbi:ADP-ribosylglycohydrolase family protein [Kibdelosporangium philippinense]|uniref:ADP-ribosylglycohydrolase family protein n=1 Tax=Kibdelosporangium philippinense TaxID=211113 RepID=A0ABS8ZVT9_9PSEU|nr:ADP-ribosylglycohydrolase family protein [Kibdelosporangium philippinense]MCE7011125.1 ADP-ribosylglycohydrolase family protein [Kibdelosporangium philippinense]